jgi:C_GCAxxG_C_C family probable redox protein
MVLAVGGHYLGESGAAALVAPATGFSGGYGDSREELCGALSGGAMVIGALFGRQELGDDDEKAIGLTAEYRARFQVALADTKCGALRERVEAPGGPGTCVHVVEEAARVLVALLEGDV